MICPKCKGKLKVISCSGDKDYVYRHRQCTKCGHEIFTEEMESSDPKTTKYLINLYKTKNKMKV